MKHDLTHVFYPIPTPKHGAWYEHALKHRKKKSGMHGLAQFLELGKNTAELISAVNSLVSGTSWLVV